MLESLDACLKQGPIISHREDIDITWTNKETNSTTCALLAIHTKRTRNHTV